MGPRSWYGCCTEDQSANATEYEPEDLHKPFCSSFPVGPKEVRHPSYKIKGCLGELVGPPLRSGTVTQLHLGHHVQECQLSLHINGFALRFPKESGGLSSTPEILLWSPFTLVEKCEVLKLQAATILWSVFKLTVFRCEGMDLCYYFACGGVNADEEREAWVKTISSMIQNVTTSLFPDFVPRVQPIPGKSETTSRLLAGYLLFSGSADSVDLIYCELHAHKCGRSRLVLYKDEWCEQAVLSIPILETSTVSTRRGYHCTVFGVDRFRFSSRTSDEKELWLRAVSNIRVKLMFDAPDPTYEDLEVYRSAVKERVATLEKRGSSSPALGDKGDDHEVCESTPVLDEVTRVPPPCPVGDLAESPESGVEAAGPIQRDAPAGVRGQRMDVREPENCRLLLSSVAEKIRRSLHGDEGRDDSTSQK